MQSFEQKLKRQMILNRVNKIKSNASLDEIYRSMMVKGLHNKMKVS